MRITQAGTLRINFRDFLPHDKRRIRCNYRCRYCNQAGVRQVDFTADNFTQASNLWDRLRAVEDRLLVKANFDGEIFADNWAQKICFYICGLPNVSRFEFITNNSLDPDVYMAHINPSKAVFNCSFHPDFVGIEQFITHMLKLKRYGSRAFATMVVTPERAGQLGSFVSRFRSEGILLKPILLLGRYQPRVPRPLKRLHKNLCRLMDIKTVFPEAYSKRTLGIIRRYYYSDLEFEYQYGKRTKGSLCYAGSDMINLYKDGTVMRCFTEKLGSIDDLLSGGLRLATGPRPCPAETCQCPTHMIFLDAFRQHYSLCDDYADHYYPRKEPVHAEEI
ncbi:MAG TPA: hypothetical protein VMD52_04185 [Patescibacteria group bacterium]|nr:hypothetical protein [Patescibacteria group bacterium]